MKYLLIYLAITLVGISETLLSQTVSAPKIKTYNFSYFSADNLKSVSESLESETSDTMKLHPEFGILPYNAPCSDCDELLDKRTENSRYFIDKIKGAKYFHSEQSLYDISYRDSNNVLRTLDSRLKSDPLCDKCFNAIHQPIPTFLNLNTGYTAIQMMDGWKLEFNGNTSIYGTDDIYEEGTKQVASREHYTVGDDGAYLTEFFQSIDQKQVFKKGAVETDYVIHDLSAIDTTKKYFVIEDDIILPENYTWQYDTYEGEYTKNHLWKGDLLLENASNIEFGRMNVPIVLDADTTDTFYPEDSVIDCIAGYKVEQNGSLCKVKIFIETKWLTNPGRKFPIIIDPLVSGTAATWTGMNGSSFSPAWCDLTVNVTTPANATLTGASIYWNILALGITCSPSKCFLNKIQAQVQTTCDYSPPASPPGSLVWVCSPGCGGTGGNWIPTLSAPNLVTCFTPQCSSYSIPFTMKVNRVACSTGVCATNCIALAEFDVTISGYTLDGNALTDGSDVASYIITDCAHQYATLSANPQYGVPSYSYLWDDGSTGSTLFVTPPMGATTLYAVTVTDACGNNYTDNISITNPCGVLPIQISTFTGYNSDQKNYLNWTTQTEENNASFEVERSETGSTFEKIGSIAGAGSSAAEHTYTFVDDKPSPAINYYRLKQLDYNGDSTYSNIIAIKSTNLTTLSIALNGQNPITNYLDLSIVSPTAGKATIYIYNMLGQNVFEKQLEVGKGLNTSSVTLPLLASGNYILTLQKDGIKTQIKISKQ